MGPLELMVALWSRGATPSLTSTATTIDALIMTILGGIAPWSAR
jgi:hypothetical protein